jgi:hypothetical protein
LNFADKNYLKITGAIAKKTYEENDYLIFKTISTF